MNEQSPSTPEEPQLREDVVGWPWGQLFILVCCLLFCTFELINVLKVMRVGVHSSIHSLQSGLLVSGLIVAVLALYHSARLKVRGQKLRRLPRLRHVNIGLSSLGLLLLLLSMVIPAASSARATARRLEREQAAATENPELSQTIRSANGLFAIDIPAHWEEAPAAAVAAQGVMRADIASDLWVVIWSEPREDLAVSTLDEYAESIIKLLEAEYEQLDVLERTNSTVTGQTTLEIVIRVVIDNAKLMIAMRFAEMPDHFVQVRAWAVPSRFRRHEATLRQMLRSVRRE